MLDNNSILRRMRYAFDINDAKMIEIFELGGLAVTRSKISNWLKKDSDSEYQEIREDQFIYFLDGFIIEKRGKKEGNTKKSEKILNNNIILRKIKIALNMKVEEMVEIFELADFNVGKHEISAFFRNPTQRQYRPCQDQFLRNFIYGLQLKYRNQQNKKA